MHLSKLSENVDIVIIFQSPASIVNYKIQIWKAGYRCLVVSMVASCQHTILQHHSHHTAELMKSFLKITRFFSLFLIFSASDNFLDFYACCAE